MNGKGSKSIIHAYATQNRLRHAIGSYYDYQLSLLLKRPIVRHLPPALMLEPTNVCNLRCPLCPSGNGTLRRARGFMPIDRYRHIVDQIHKHIGMLILWNQGEPFLHSEFYDMITYASGKDMYTMTSTNASLPLDPVRIVKSGLSKIIISLDGISAETYNNYRINGDISLVIENMKSLIECKNRMKSSTPQIVWQFIIMSHNEHEIDKVKELSRKLGVDKLEFKTAQIYTTDDLNFLPQNHKYSRYKSSRDTVELKTELLNRCRRLWTQPVINWDGEFSVCCYDKDLSIPIGNIDSTSFHEMWFGQKLNKLRFVILKNRAQIDICKNCGEGIIQKIKS